MVKLKQIIIKSLIYCFKKFNSKGADVTLKECAKWLLNYLGWPG